MKMNFPDELWGIIKDFLLEWKKAWQKKITLCHNSYPKNHKINQTFITNNIWKNINSYGIKSLKETILFLEFYNINTRLHYSTYLLPWSNHDSPKEIEIVSNYYDNINWFEDIANYEYWTIENLLLEYLL
jgi:hypothetical protein